MNDPIPLRAIDRKARDDAARAIALIEKHAAVCEERTRQDDDFQAHMRDFLARFEAAQQSAIAGVREQIAALGERLHRELRTHQEDDARTLREIESARAAALLEIAAKISASVRPLYNRFWALAVALIGALAVLSGFLSGKLLGWL